ncbi:hypothetical protein [Microcoleus anatoxicus]|uniref:Uncharacterized protein n=1 Tax=Microcoleus anatoxicus PTRS2 TaxID=2705321 RepID=A0ABU8YPW4_9CYAN
MKEEGRRKKEEGRRKKEEGRRKRDISVGAGFTNNMSLTSIIS